MIKEVNREDFLKILDERKDIKDSLVSKECLKNNEQNSYALMISEDGTNFLQGIGVINTYLSTKIKGKFRSKILCIWIAPECRRIGFGRAMIENLERISSRSMTSKEESNSEIECFDCQVKIPESRTDLREFFKSLSFSENVSRGISLMTKKYL